VLLGFATLMLGMDTMSQAVSGLKDIPAFSQMFIMFKNPILGVIAGAVLTAIIQSSSASVGILQALAITGQVSYGAAIPIIMGQNIGTCITALISSVGTGKNARRTAYAHMIFNILGTVIWLSVFVILSYTLKNAFFDKSASLFGIAAAHSIFNILCTIVLFPMSSVIEKMTIFIFPDKEDASKNSELDERLLVTPPIALQKCHDLVCHMSDKVNEACNLSLDLLFNYDKDKADIIINTEEFADRYEDIIGSYLVKLSSRNISDEDNATVTMLLKLISDFERICDHSINVLEAATELHEKGIILSDNSKKELSVLCSAVKEILSHSHMAFINNDYKLASHIEPLEQVIDNLKYKMRNTHIARLKINESTIEESFIWSDILTNLERISDHCSNIALSVLETSKGLLKPHEYLSNIKNDAQNDFSRQYKYYLSKYSI